MKAKWIAGENFQSAAEAELEVFSYCSTKH